MTAGVFRLPHIYQASGTKFYQENSDNLLTPNYAPTLWTEVGELLEAGKVADDTGSAPSKESEDSEESNES